MIVGVIVQVAPSRARKQRSLECLTSAGNYGAFLAGRFIAGLAVSARAYTLASRR